VHAAIVENYKGEFDVVSNPEFLREGVAVDDFMKPDRVVIGVTSERARSVMAELFSPFVRSGNPVIFMDERSAELTKYAANAFLAVKISFMNEIAQLCEKLGADVDMVRRGVGSDDRIGKRFLFPGIGYGGSCFPKDVKALVKSADDAGYDFKILDAVMDVNERQKLHLIPQELEIAVADRISQDPHLPSRVVEVVFAFDIMAGPFEHPGDRVAEYGTASMSDRQGARGVGTHELDLNFAAFPGRGPPVGVPGPQELFELAEIIIPCERKVDEAGSGDLDKRHERGVGFEPCGDLRGDLPALLSGPL